MQFHSINNGLSVLQNCPSYAYLGNAIAAAPLTTAAQFRASLEVSLRNTASGWSATEFKFTSIQPPKAGRPRAIDFCDTAQKMGVELELSNQNAISHDFLKLNTAFKNNYISFGVLVVPELATRTNNQWAGDNWYSTFEYAATWLDIYAPSLDAPIVVWGF